ncbi:MAG: hypothetical protein ABH808_03535 [Candidatus Kuenenbacteria bacterium]
MCSPKSKKHVSIADLRNRQLHISSLQLITTIGVVAGILGYLNKDTLPKFTSIGLIYFSLLIIMTWIINGIVSKFFKNKKYDIEEQDIEKDIK